MNECICNEYDGKGRSVCGVPCPEHSPPPPANQAEKGLIDEAVKVYIQTMNADPELKPWQNGLPNFHAEGFKAAIRFATLAERKACGEKAVEREKLWLDYKKTRDMYDIAAAMAGDKEALASDWDSMRALKDKKDALIKKLGETAPKQIESRGGVQ